MPTLTWIGKEAVANHHIDVPYRLIESDPVLSKGDPSRSNMLLEGDNLLALKALLPYYGGQIKCIYIDPPYNTGKQNWVFNDNNSSPEIRQWLGEVVGKEGEDLTRHDKWLCMMYPRLKLLQKLLANDGVIFISINDVECAALRMICDEIFGPANFLAQLIWNSEGNTDNQLEIKVKHEYIMLYTKRAEQRDKAIGRVIDPNTREDSNLWKGFADNNINKNNPANPPDIIELPVGFPCSVESLIYQRKQLDEKFFDVTRQEKYVSDQVKKKYNIENISGLPIKLDDMIVENYKLTKPCRIYGGFANKNKLLAFIENGLEPIDDEGSVLSYYLNKNAAVRYRRMNEAPRNILSVLRNFGTTEKSRTKLKRIGIDFDYPKPVELIKYLLKIGAQPKDSLILDSFAGSGTTGEAVLALNRDDGGSRRFILVEMDKALCRNITYTRLTSTASKPAKKQMATSQVLVSDIQYCRLGDVLFDASGNIRPSIAFADLARHVFFTETGHPLPEQSTFISPLIGIHNGVAIYLLYNGVLPDTAAGRNSNVLTRSMLATLPPHQGLRVIYADGCLLSKQYLQSAEIVFRQIPYEVRVN